MWINYNANPLGRNINDCVVRSVSLAENKSWDNTYGKLSTIARLQGRLLDEVLFVEPYLNKNYVIVCERCKDCKMTIGEFAKLFDKGIYLVTMQGHITCIIDGDIYDTFDCSDRFLWCAWQVEK